MKGVIPLKNCLFDILHNKMRTAKPSTSLKPLKKERVISKGGTTENGEALNKVKSPQ